VLTTYCAVCYLKIAEGQEPNGRKGHGSTSQVKKGGENMTTIEVLTLIEVIAVVTLGIINLMQKK